MHTNKIRGGSEDAGRRTQRRHTALQLHQGVSVTPFARPPVPARTPHAAAAAITTDPEPHPKSMNVSPLLMRASSSTTGRRGRGRMASPAPEQHAGLCARRENNVIRNSSYNRGRMTHVHGRLHAPIAAFVSNSVRQGNHGPFLAAGPHRRGSRRGRGLQNRCGRERLAGAAGGRHIAAHSGCKGVGARTRRESGGKGILSLDC